MRIRVSCPACDEEFTVPETQAGKRVSCRGCGDPVRVPKSGGGKSGASRGGRKGGGKDSAKPVQYAMIGAAVLVGLILVGTGVSYLTSKPKAYDNEPSPATTTSNPAMSSQQYVAAVPTTPASSNPPTTDSGTGRPANNPPALANNSGSTDKATGSSTSSGGSSVSTGESADKSTEEEEEEKPKPKKPKKPKTSDDEMSLPDLIAKIEPSVVRINVTGKQGTSQGSGYVVDDEGTVVTNYHVIEGAVRANVEFSNKSETEVLGFKLVKPKYDIAIIKIDLSKLKKKPPALAIADELPKKGISAVAFGTPLGLSFTASEGIVSAIRPKAEMVGDVGTDVEGTWLQTTCPISPGNSGGPLTDTSGRLVGMNTMQFRVGQNLNFAISCLDVAEAIAEAPDKVTPLSPDSLKSYDKSLAMKGASDVVGTKKGKRLLAGLQEIFLINVTDVRTLRLDPSGTVWTRVIARSKTAVEKGAKIALSVDEPLPDAALMLVMFELRNFRGAAAKPGTQEMFVKIQVLCPDLKAKKNEAHLCKIWEIEGSVGTVARQALFQGTFPQSADDKLAALFSKFPSAYKQAVTESKNMSDDDDDEDEKPASKGGKASKGDKDKDKSDKGSKSSKKGADDEADVDSDSSDDSMKASEDSDDEDEAPAKKPTKKPAKKSK